MKREERVHTMFLANIGKDIYDISHMALAEPSEHLYYKHMHSYCELLLFVEGDMDFCIGGDYYHLQPYDLLLIPQGTYHYGSLRTAARYENYVIDFYDVLLPPETIQKLFSPPTVFNIGGDKLLLQYFRLLDTYHERYSKTDFLFCAECLVREILIYCCYTSRISSPVIRERSTLIQNILDYIDKHLEEKLDVEILAENLNLSRSHIQNVFSQSMQIGLKQYIMQKKIFAAHNDLINGYSATAAAGKYHFNDYSTFFRVYKKTFGTPPSDTGKNDSRPSDRRK